jgi:hypothetical protein
MRQKTVELLASIHVVINKQSIHLALAEQQKNGSMLGLKMFIF